MAALLSGEIDFVLDPPIQDLPRLEKNPGMKVVNGTENRTIFLGMDVWRDELLYGSVKGKNPFKDARVRRAMYHAIDIEAIKNQVMRGLARPAGTMIAPSVFGYTKEADKRLAFDPVRARKLLAEAGYPTGFEVTLDCPNNRYVNDEKICVALAAMLAKVDIKVKVNAMSRALFFPKVQKYDTSFYLIGWGVATLDSLNALQTVIHSPGKGADGEQNYGKYSNATVDAAIDKLKVENDPKRRIELTTEALMLHREEAGHIPLHYPIIPWAMRSGVTVNHLSNNWFMVKWVTVK
jgi:peptide/nickel transport system substrate-binding protein